MSGITRAARRELPTIAEAGSLRAWISFSREPAVELFQISCVTCRARLRVRDARFIGQILACPKCNSMVEIAPPAGWAPPSEVAATLPLAAAAVVTRSSVALSPVENVASAAMPASKLSGVLSHLLHSTVVWWSAGGIATMAAVAFGASLAWHGNRDSTTPIQPAVATAAAAPAEPKPDSGVCQGLAAAMDERSKLDFATDDETEKVGAVKAAEPGQVDNGGKSPDTDAASPNMDFEPAATLYTTSTMELQHDSAKPTNAANVASSPAEPSRTLKLESVPGDLMVASANGESLTAGTQLYSSPRNDMEARGRNAEDVSPATPPAMDAPHPLLRFGPSTQDAAHRTDIADQVAMAIQSFDMADAPLNRVLETLANLAAVPITVDPAVLSTAGVSPDTKVTVHAHDTTVGKLIGSVLREHNLVCRMSDGQLMIVNQ
jgi:hypothetical protein